MDENQQGVKSRPVHRQHAYIRIRMKIFPVPLKGGCSNENVSFTVGLMITLKHVSTDTINTARKM